jgi:hypothetical protein
MTGNRDLIEASKKFSKGLKDNGVFDKVLGKALEDQDETLHLTYLLRLYQQSKQISQIIAYIWRWSDDNSTGKEKSAKDLASYFEHPSEDGVVGANLKKLFSVKPKQGGNKEEDLLYQVFGNGNKIEGLIFPIFNEFERGKLNNTLGYLFGIDINTFHGEILDPTPNHPQLFSFFIPYPPRPAVGNATVTNQELEGWVDNREKDKFFADNIYIPTTCS